VTGRLKAKLAGDSGKGGSSRRKKPQVADADAAGAYGGELIDEDEFAEEIAAAEAEAQATAAAAAAPAAATTTDAVAAPAGAAAAGGASPQQKPASKRARRK
jgi:hypothetical protein